MQVPVRSNFVARIADRRDELGVALGDPPDHEHRGADPGAIEQIEQEAGGQLDAGGQRVPALGRERRPRAADVKPLFEINREDVPRRRYPLARSLVM